MNELQKCQLALLKEFVRVCETLDLTYYLVCGSALGAVRHGGFIPWDDDIDVALPRRDYERFLREAPGLLPGHLFVQSFHTDPCFPYIYGKLRDSRTTCIEKNTAHLPIHHGVGMDIFPLDGCPRGKCRRLVFELRKKWYLHLLGAAFAPPRGLMHRLEYRLKRLLGVHRRSAAIAKRFDALLRKYPPEDSPLWCSHGGWQGTLEYAPREQYGTGAFREFEGLRVRIPQQYHAYLTQKYGDYMTPPPRQESHHRYVVVDCHRPYPEYYTTEDVS